jgi:predicted Fe-Mo cluster-binding NifX family protein
MRVAVASEDGKTIRQHFGKALQFMIYDVAGPDIRLVEIRENEPACRGPGQPHYDAYLSESVELVSDCGAVLAAQIGPVAQAQLASRNIAPFQVTGLIEPLLSRLAQYLGQIPS